MASKILTGYLAGSIRDGIPEDINWREQMIAAMDDLPVRFINPLGGKNYDPETKKWSAAGIPSSARLIVKHDFWSVDHSDFVVFNFRALSQKYPNIGTLIEFGRATGAGAIIYSIVDPDYTGHENVTMYHLHPFIEENSAVVFSTTEECIAFLKRFLPAITGLNPRYQP